MNISKRSKKCRNNMCVANHLISRATEQTDAFLNANDYILLCIIMVAKRVRCCDRGEKSSRVDEDVMDVRLHCKVTFSHSVNYKCKIWCCVVTNPTHKLTPPLVVCCDRDINNIPKRLLFNSINLEGLLFIAAQ